jgi:hypothetical protein
MYPGRVPVVGHPLGLSLVLSQQIWSKFKKGSSAPTQTGRQDSLGQVLGNTTAMSQNQYFATTDIQTYESQEAIKAWNQDIYNVFPIPPNCVHYCGIYTSFEFTLVSRHA